MIIHDNNWLFLLVWIPQSFRQALYKGNESRLVECRHKVEVSIARDTLAECAKN